MSPPPDPPQSQPSSSSGIPRRPKPPVVQHLGTPSGSRAGSANSSRRNSWDTRRPMPQRTASGHTRGFSNDGGINIEVNSVPQFRPSVDYPGQSSPGFSRGPMHSGHRENVYVHPHFSFSEGLSPGPYASFSQPPSYQWSNYSSRHGSHASSDHGTHDDTNSHPASDGKPTSSSIPKESHGAEPDPKPKSLFFDPKGEPLEAWLFRDRDGSYVVLDYLEPELSWQTALMRSEMGVVQESEGTSGQDVLYYSVAPTCSAKAGERKDSWKPIVDEKEATSDAVGDPDGRLMVRRVPDSEVTPLSKTLEKKKGIKFKHREPDSQDILQSERNRKRAYMFRCKSLEDVTVVSTRLTECDALQDKITTLADQLDNDLAKHEAEARRIGENIEKMTNRMYTLTGPETAMDAIKEDRGYIETDLLTMESLRAKIESGKNSIKSTVAELRSITGGAKLELQLLNNRLRPKANIM